MKIPVLLTAHKDTEGCEYYYNLFLTTFDPEIFTFVVVCSAPESYEKLTSIYTAPNFIIVQNYNDYGKIDGCIYNFVTGFNFIHDNFEYDYLCQSATDGGWCSPKKILDICNEMKKLDKTFLLYGDVIYDKKLYYPTSPNYSIPPYNQWGRFYPAFGAEIFSKYFFEKQFDLNIHSQKLILAGETYVSAVIRDTNNLDSEEKLLAFMKRYGLSMDFDRYKTYDPTFIIQQTDFLPDSFVKYGWFTWRPGQFELGKKYIEQHLPLLRESEKYPTFQE